MNVTKLGEVDRPRGVRVDVGVREDRGDLRVGRVNAGRTREQRLELARVDRARAVGVELVEKVSRA